MNFKSIFPSMPRGSLVVNQNGTWTSGWFSGFSELFQALQRNFKTEGIMFPVLDSSQIAAIEAQYAPYIGGQLPPGVDDISGQTVFDLTNRVSKQFVIVYDSSSPPQIISATWRTLQYV